MTEENINSCIIFYLNLMYPSLLLNLSVMSWTLTLRLYPLYWRYQARLVQHIKELFRVYLVENMNNIFFLKYYKVTHKERDCKDDLKLLMYVNYEVRLSILSSI